MGWIVASKIALTTFAGIGAVKGHSWPKRTEGREYVIGVAWFSMGVFVITSVF